jgi:hypothetical protein
MEHTRKRRGYNSTNKKVQEDVRDDGDVSYSSRNQEEVRITKNSETYGGIRGTN